MMIFEICMHGGIISRVLFDDAEQAKAELEKAKKALENYEPYGNNKLTSHTIVSSVGEMVVNLQYLCNFNLFNDEEWDKRTLLGNTKQDDYKLERLIKEKQALKDAGLSDIK